MVLVNVTPVRPGGSCWNREGCCCSWLHPANRRRQAATTTRCLFISAPQTACHGSRGGSGACRCYARRRSVCYRPPPAAGPCAAPRPRPRDRGAAHGRSEEHTSELQSHHDLVCRLLLEKKKSKRKSKRRHS